MQEKKEKIQKEAEELLSQEVNELLEGELDTVTGGACWSCNKSSACSSNTGGR